VIVQVSAPALVVQIEEFSVVVSDVPLRPGVDVDDTSVIVALVVAAPTYWGFRVFAFEPALEPEEMRSVNFGVES
jgi:hypothetical protein